MNKLSHSEIGWLAGIIDGEGSIGIQRQPNGNKTVVLKVKMTDKDVIDNLQLVTGVGNIFQVKTQPKNRKPAWVWNVYKVKDVTHILCTIASHPLLSQRRREKILEVTDVAIAAMDRIKLNPRSRGHKELTGGR